MGEIISEQNQNMNKMIWSYSRLDSFATCPYAWQRHYLENEPGESNAYAEFGSLVHKVIEMYAKGELQKEDLPDYYEFLFETEINTDFPYPSEETKEKYFIQGYEYFQDFPIDLQLYDVLGVEKDVHFKIEGHDFIGFIDLLLRDKNTGEITVLDNKSATLKFKKNGEVSKTDLWHLEKFKRQLYLYTKPVIEEFGKVDWISWNLFRVPKIYRVPFD